MILAVIVKEVPKGLISPNKYRIIIIYSVTLFVDEPISNLDHKGLELLKQKLAQAETLLLISQDRDLIDGLCHKIIEVKDGKLAVYEGNFSSYRKQKLVETEREWFEYNQYQRKKESTYFFRKENGK